MEIDYKAKKMHLQNMRDGDLKQFMNLATLRRMAISLSALKLYKIRGWGQLGAVIAESWYDQLKRQAPTGWLSAFGLLYSFRIVGRGIADLVLLPYDEYTKSGTSGIIKGVTKGTTSFAKNVFVGTTDLGLRIISSTQNLLENVTSLIDSSPSSQPKSLPQPTNAAEGVLHAVDSVSRNLKDAANTIIIPLEVYKKYGTKGFITSVLRAVPIAILKPVKGSLEGVGQVLRGAQTSVDPNSYDVTKYKS